MTALGELKQKMKEIYGEYDTFILPVLKFVLAFVTFQIINSSLGFMSQLSNIFVVLILAILCSILPPSAMVFTGFVLVLGHCYALSLEAAGFALVLVIVLLILFLRFSTRENVAFILAPAAFYLHIPAALPVGCGLLSGPASAVPAGCGVVLYYFMKLVKEQEDMLKDADGDKMEKLKGLLDGLIQNQEMWLAIMAIVVVCLVVYVIRKMFVSYSWHIAILVGCAAYLVIMIAGGGVLDVKISMASVALSAAASLIVGFILEFFVMGVDYSRTQNLQFEDDEYVYYVKAVPKSYVTGREKSRKKQAFGKNNRKAPKEYLDEELPDTGAETEEDIPLERINVDDIDFEEKLEHSLKDL